MGLLDGYKGLVGGYDKRFNSSRKIWNPIKRLIRFVEILDMDVRIRDCINIHKNKNYCNLGLDDFQNDLLYAQELRAIEDIFNTNRSFLKKHFTAEEIYELKSRFGERAKLWYELRRDGVEKFGLENINKLKELETEPFARDALDSFACDFVYYKSAQDNELIFKQLGKNRPSRYKEKAEGFNDEVENRTSIQEYFVKYQLNYMLDEEINSEDPQIRPIIVLPNIEKGKTKSR